MDNALPKVIVNVHISTTKLIVAAAIIAFCLQASHFLRLELKESALYEACLSQTTGNVNATRHCRFRAIALMQGGAP